MGERDKRKREGVAAPNVLNFSCFFGLGSTVWKFAAAAVYNQSYFNLTLATSDQFHTYLHLCQTIRTYCIFT